MMIRRCCKLPSSTPPLSDCFSNTLTQLTLPQDIYQISHSSPGRHLWLHTTFSNMYMFTYKMFFVCKIDWVPLWGKLVATHTTDVVGASTDFALYWCTENPGSSHPCFCPRWSVCRRWSTGWVRSCKRQMLLADRIGVTLLFGVMGKDVCKLWWIRNRWQLGLSSLYLCQQSFPPSLIHHTHNASDICIHEFLKKMKLRINMPHANKFQFSFVCTSAGGKMVGILLLLSSTLGSEFTSHYIFYLQL